MSTVIMGPRAKLSPADIADARRRRRAGATLVELADSFGVSRAAIQHAVSPRRWAADQAYAIHRIEARGFLCSRCRCPDCPGCFAVAELGEVVF